MKIIIFDSEYLSLSKKYSDIKSLIRFKKKLFPEIIQISFLKYSNFFSKKNKKKKLNIFIKTEQKPTRRIVRLTGITQKLLKEKGYKFINAMNLIDQFIEKKAILIANGDDLKLIKININHNKIKKTKKKQIYHLNIRKILKKIDRTKKFNTQDLSKIFKFKFNLRLHDASNDCIVIHKLLKKLVKIYGRKKFENMINDNKKLIYF